MNCDGAFCTDMHKISLSLVVSISIMDLKCQPVNIDITPDADYN